MPSVRQFAKVEWRQHVYGGRVLRPPAQCRTAVLAPRFRLFCGAQRHAGAAPAAAARQRPGRHRCAHPRAVFGRVGSAAGGRGLAAARVVWRGHHPRCGAPRDEDPRQPPARLRPSAGLSQPCASTWRRSCRDELFAVEPDQVLLTHGATHAFDLILRTLTRPGDMRARGRSRLQQSDFADPPPRLHCRRHPARRGGARFRGAGRRRRRGQQPKLMFVNTVLQNPLGTSLSQAQAHRLLGVAEQFDFWLVEDDIYRELAARGEASLAAMDGLRRVIRVGSFSKTLSPVLRVGSICASSFPGARTAARENAGGADHLRDQRARRLPRRLGAALPADGGAAGQPADASAANAASSCWRDAGMTPIARPRGGMFVSAGWDVAPTPALQRPHDRRPGAEGGHPARARRILHAAPPPPAIWFRFNVAYAADAPALATFLQAVRP